MEQQANNMDYYTIFLVSVFIYAICIFIFDIFFPSSSSSDEKDVVGDILKEQGIPRNPPEASGSISSVPPQGQISSFDEGPVVINETSNVTG